MLKRTWEGRVNRARFAGIDKIRWFLGLEKNITIALNTPRRTHRQ